MILFAKGSWSLFASLSLFHSRPKLVSDNFFNFLREYPLSQISTSLNIMPNSFPYLNRMIVRSLRLKNRSYSTSLSTSILKEPIFDSNTWFSLRHIPQDIKIEQANNHPDEIIFAKSNALSVKQYNTFLGGRQALRESINILNNSYDYPILRDSYGAPSLQYPVHGTISHKDDIVVALATIDNKWSVGVDIERCYNSATTKLQKRILTENELAQLTSNEHYSKEEDSLLRFSIKESIYKAIHPILLRPIGFHEVEVYPSLDGSATINFLFGLDMNITYQIIWRRYTAPSSINYWLTAVRIKTY